MPNYTAQDVKKLREDTDAPMMECKSALDEADGDFEKAKNILREKGKVAAAKRAGRSTAAGVVAFSSTPNMQTVGGVVLECETDFVARNEDFIAIAQNIADLVRDGAQSDDAAVSHLIESAVAKIRENIKVARSVRLTSPAGIVTYVHHDRTKGAAVVLAEGNPANEAIRKVAVHSVAFPPEVLSKGDLSQEAIEREVEIETQRAINEGKPDNIARNIAQGRVNKEFVKRVVLLEQPFYLDPGKSVSDYVKETAPGTTFSKVVYLAVGQGA